MDKKIRFWFIRKWLMLTAAVFLLLIINTVSVLRAFADTKAYELKDMAGHTLYTDESGNILASSDIIFSFSGLSSPFEEDPDKDRDWVFCERESVNNRYIYTPVKNNSFRLNVREDTEIAFLWIDRISGDTAFDRSLPDAFSILYASDADIEPEAELSYGEKTENNGTYLSGSSPVLTVNKRPFSHTYLTISDGDEKETIEIVDEKKEFKFDEGIYSLSLWGEDGWGVKYPCSLPVKNFTYDAGKPAIGEIKVNSSEKDAFTRDGIIYTSDAAIISPSATDDMSGMDYFIFHAVNKYDGGEYEAYGDTLQLNPCFYGTVGVKAVDKAGNISDEVTSSVILIDKDSPRLKDRSVKESKKDAYKLLLSFKTEDLLSGLRRNELFINNSSLKKESFSGDKEGAIEANIDLQELEIGENHIRLECEDLVGNIKVYDFTLDKKDERKKNEDKEDSGNDSENTAAAPDMYLRGFENFQKSEKAVRIEAGINNDYPDSGTVYIERHDEDGNLTNAYAADPGLIDISDEGNYVVRYEISGKNNVYEEYGYFTIDRSSPVIASLRDIDKKIFNGFSLRNDPLSNISDYTYVNARMTLSGREYDGHEVTEPGRYLLKLEATDELGHSTEESAEFVIIRDDKKPENKGETPSQDSIKHRQSKTHGMKHGTEAEIKPEMKHGKTDDKKASLSKDDILLIENEVSMNSGVRNLTAPGSSAREVTIYKKEAYVLPAILLIGALLCISCMIILVVNPALERNG